MSRPSGVAVWVGEHRRTAGILLLSSAVLLLAIAGGIGYTMFTGLSATTGERGSSGEPSASAATTASASAAGTSVGPSVGGAPSVSPSLFTGFQYFDILQVEVNDLAVRVEPTRTSPLMHGYRVQSDPEALGEVRLNPGDFVRVFLGPLTIGDTVWYLLSPAPDLAGNYYSAVVWSNSSESMVPSLGWAAASVGQDQYLALNRNSDPREYDAWINIPGGPKILSASGSGNYDSGPQVRHDMYSFKWAIALGDQPAPCAFAVRLLPDDGSEPVLAIERSTASVDQGPMQGPEGILTTPWPGSAGGTQETFTVSIRSACTWTVGIEPLAHD